MSNPNENGSGYISDGLGETSRLSEFKLTEKAIELCNFTQTDKILDLACGTGATISYLYNKYHIKAIGIDPSEKLLNIAKGNCDFADFIKGSGESLPFEDESFDCVISECALSFINDINAMIQEVNRVLTKNGWFVVTDVYSENPREIQELEGYTFHSGMTGLHDLDLLQQKIEKLGFKILYLGDYSNYKPGCFIMIAKRGEGLYEKK